MKIDYIFKLIRLLLRKERAGFIKDSDIAIAVNAAQNDVFTKYLELYKKTGVYSSKIKQFIKTAAVALASGSGTTPTDLVHPVTFWHTSNTLEGLLLEVDEFIDRKQSVLAPPDAIEAVCLIDGVTTLVLPTSLSTINLKYFRAPNPIVYAVTVDGDGRGTSINTGASTDTEFNTDAQNELVKAALLYLGVSIDDQDAISIGVAESNKPV